MESILVVARRDGLGDLALHFHARYRPTELFARNPFAFGKSEDGGENGHGRMHQEAGRQTLAMATAYRKIVGVN